MFGSRGIAGLYPGSGLGMARGGFSWMKLLTGVQNSLGLVNQAIPLYRQARPLFGNMKTMFKIASALRSNPSNQNTAVTYKNNEKKSESIVEPTKHLNNPTFFL